MLRSLTFGKISTALMLVALPVLSTGCRAGGLSMPSLASLNPWRSTAANAPLASTKPSSVPTPPAQMLAGNGLARGTGAAGAGTAAGSGASTYNANTYGGGRPSGGNAAGPNDYGTRQVSATQNEGYPTGRYATGGAGTGSQPGPYGPNSAGSYGSGAASYGGGAPSYGGSQPGMGAATADRRSDPAYGSNASGGGAGLYSPNVNNGQPAASGGAPSASGPYQGSQNNPNGVSNPYAAASAYAGTMGQSVGGRTSASSTTGDAYRPGSTARSSAVQPASYDSRGPASNSASGAMGGADANYPTTSAGDDSHYQ